ncbi:MAG: ABC transporter substrate-binding protein [Actinomycetota bacterium]|nr:ABC transporter substrate-binding protein [Actinomycetota bacterium]
MIRSICFAFLAFLPFVGCTRTADKAVISPDATKQTHRGGVLTVAIGQPDGIDPGSVHEPNGQLVASMMCDQLIMLDPVSGRPRPAIAEGWTVTDNGRKLFVKIRKNVMFQNGRQLVADDIGYTLSRVASLEFASLASDLLRNVVGFPFVHGDLQTRDDHLRQRLSGVKIVDDHSVEIDLDRPFADFYRALADPALSPVPHEEVERDPHAFEAKPVCAGPYKLRSAFTGNTITLDRFGSYYGKNAAFVSGGDGYASGVIFELTSAGGPIPADVSIAQVVSGQGGPMALTTQVELLGFPTSLPPFDEPTVRRAISLAIDREAVASNVYQHKRVPADRFIPASIESATSRRCAADVGAKPNLEQARLLLSKAKVSLSGVKVKFYYNDEFANSQLMDSIATQLQAAFGIEPAMMPMQWEDYLAKGTKGSGFDGVFRYAWSPRYPSADAVIFPLFHSDSIGRDNLSRFSSRDLDEAILTARKDADDADRRLDYARAETIVCDQMPMTPLVFDRRGFTFSANVDFARGKPFSSFSAMPNLREAFLK